MKDSLVADDLAAAIPRLARWTALDAVVGAVLPKELLAERVGARIGS
jgi:hypothetical protein